MAAAHDHNQLLLRRNADGLSGELKSGLPRSFERRRISCAGGFAIDLGPIDTAIGMDELEWRTPFTNEVTARAQSVPACILLGHCEQPDCSKQRAPGPVALAAAESRVGAGRRS